MPGMDCNTNDVNNVKLLVKAGMMNFIDEAMLRLTSMSNSLIYKTNNPDETFINNIAKTTGGKRIDFSRSGNYKRRVKVAGFSYNQPGQVWHKGLMKKRYNGKLTSPMNRLLHKRRLKLCNTRDHKKGRRLHFDQLPKPSTSADLDYGANDVLDDQIKIMCEEFYSSKVQVTDDRRNFIEKETREQSKSMC